MTSARLTAIRSAVRSHRAVVNLSELPIRTEFHALELGPNGTELTFSGCGHMNPIQIVQSLGPSGPGRRY